MATRGSTLLNHTGYLDHATTSGVKAPGVVERMVEVLTTVCASPGRGRYRRAEAADELIESCRARVARFFGCDEASRVIFTSGTTVALNLAIKGVLSPGDHAVATCFDHNSVLRPLTRLARTGVRLSVAGVNASDEDFAQSVIREFRPRTRLVVINHATNVFGSLLPCAEIASAARSQGILTLLDVAQTAGHLPIDAQLPPVDLIAFGGHKGLLGPPGVGGLVVGPGVELRPLLEGGTGHSSQHLEPPVVMPSSFEPGTPNTAAIAALEPAIDFVSGSGYEPHRQQAQASARRCADLLGEVAGVTVHAEPDVPSVPVVSFTVRGLAPAQVAGMLDADFDIQVRAGLHCAPLAHRRARTFPQGTVRASFGYGNTGQSAELLCGAVTAICEKSTR